MRAPQHLRPYASVLDTVGWTPLIHLARIGAGLRTPIYGKAEYANPGGSVKDRIGLAIIEDAERRGELQPGGTIVEGTSGNTGVGLAIAAALKGYRCIFTMPDKMSQEKVRLLQGIRRRGGDHPDGRAAGPSRQLRDEGQADRARTRPGAVLANQFYNPVNPEAHYATTGPGDLGADRGEGHPFRGGRRNRRNGERRREVPQGKEPQDPDHRRRPGRLALHPLPSDPHAGEGHPYKVEGIGGDKIPTTIWFDWIDEFRQVPDRTSLIMARRLAREEGILAGGSTGLNVALALDLARELDDPDA